MQLYERIQTGKRVSYKPYTPPIVDFREKAGDLEPGYIVNLVGTLGVGLLIGIERMLPDKTKISRETKKVHEAILNLYQSTGQRVDETVLGYGIDLWNEMMLRIQTDARKEPL